MARSVKSVDLPRGSGLLLRAFSIIARRRLRRGFRAVRLLHAERLRELPSGPVVIYLNHPSWWDPLACIAIARRLLPGRMHRAPISELALEEYRFFRNLGMFPVEQDSPRGATQFLRAAKAVLAANGVLWITAQGHFTDARIRPVRLMAGLGALLQRSANVTVIPLAVEYTFWNQRLPEALAAVGEPLRVAAVRERSAAGWTALLEQHLQAAQDALAEASLTRDPAAFMTVLEGKRGTSGMYGAWQRLRSRFAGQDYQADHLADAGRSRVTSQEGR